MLVRTGEKLHIMTRRQFDGDIRRHFVGEVLEAEGTRARLMGHTYVHYPNTNEFMRRRDQRTRIFDLGDANQIVNVLPPEADLASVEYVTNRDRRLVVTDHKTFALDINEFGAVA